MTFDKMADLKSSTAHIEEAEVAVEIKMLKSIVSTYAEAQRHMSVARRRWGTMLSDRRYAAAGYTGDPDENLAKTLERLREMQKAFHNVEDMPNQAPFKSENGTVN
jgi:hypothetical protein